MRLRRVGNKTCVMDFYDFRIVDKSLCGNSYADKRDYFYGGLKDLTCPECLEIYNYLKTGRV